MQLDPKNFCIDAISIVSLDEVGNEETGGNIQEENVKNSPNNSQKHALKIVFTSIFAVIFTSILFTVPWTLIPRSNSIVYQSSWYEALLPSSTFLLLYAGNEVLKLATWTKEKDLMSFRAFLKIYFLFLISYIVVYGSCYVVWSIYLDLNHPIPYLGPICVMSSWSITTLGLWCILPSDLLQMQDFRQKLKMFIAYLLWSTVVVIQNEVLSSFFTDFPSGFQFLAPFLIAGSREVDGRMRSKIVNKMLKQPDERATALVIITISSVYSVFIAIRLVDSKLTYKVTKKQREIEDEENHSKIVEDGFITKLILTEMIEGFVPIIYGTCIAMAYYGPNAHLFPNIGNTFWSQRIENIGPIFVTMFILFLVDTCSVVFNFFWLWKTMKVNFLKEVSQVFGKYWLFLAVTLAHRMITYFAATDVNYGMDGTRSFLWTTRKGWLRLMGNSSNLNYEENISLMSQE